MNRLGLNGVKQVTRFWPHIIFVMASPEATHRTKMTVTNLLEEDIKNQKFGLVLASRRKRTHDRGPLAVQWGAPAVTQLRTS